MSNHLRHCPKHRKPLPCAHCAMTAAKPVEEPVTEPSLVENAPEPVQALLRDVPQPATPRRTIGPPLDEIPNDPWADRIPLGPLNINLKSRAEIRADKARLRAQKHRDEHKQRDPEGFKKKERKRKQTERGEVKREQELEKVLESGQFPQRLSLLRTKNGPPVTAVNKYGETVRVTIGGYDTEKLTDKIAEHQRAQGGNSVFTPPAKPTAPTNPEGHESDAAEPGQTFIHNIQYLPSKEQKAMRRFIDNHMTDRPMMVCSVCRDQIAPEFRYGAGFNHLHDKHLQLFEDMMRLAKTAKKCPEDHDGMAARHGTGTRKLICGKCGKLLYKPTRMPKRAEPEVRTDKSYEPQNQNNTIILNEIQPIADPSIQYMTRV